MGTRHNVVIVGAGPVGVGLAIELGRRGISCAIIERRTQLSNVPKGQGLSHRTLEHFYFWGIADEIRAARVMPEDHPIGMVAAYDNLMGEFWRAPPARELVNDYYFQRNERVPQYGTERVLRDRMAQLPAVTAYFGWTATHVEQDRDGVRIAIASDGRQDVVEGAYAVGCDGGGSLVREQADIDRSGTDWDELMALVVFRSRELHDALKRFPDRSTYRVMHPDLAGYWMFFGRVDIGEQFFFHAPVPPGSTRENVDVAALLHRAAGFEFAFEADHVGFWDLRVQLANDYRAGRLFIAGDAAHTHPPYGGFGLNNGMEDAVNLGWKLAAVVEGWGGARLLDSYSPERQAVFRDVGEQIIGGWIDADRRFLETYDPDVDREVFEREFEEITKQYGKWFSRFEPNYEGSSVVIGPPGGITSGLGSHSFQARAGHHLAPQPLSSGRNLFEELGSGFTLVALDVEETKVDGLARAAESLGIPLTIVSDTFAEGREAYGSHLILIRPDQYVVWVGDGAPDDATQMFRTVTGRD